MSGRHQEWGSKPSHAKSRNERAEFGDEQLVQQRHDARDEPPLRYQEDLVPHQHRVGAQRNGERDAPDDLLQRREYGRHTRSGQGERREHKWRTRSHRDERVYSGTDELVGRSDKRLNMNEGVSHTSPPPVGSHRRRHVNAEYEDYEDEAMGKSKHVYGYDDHVQFSKHDYSDGRFRVDNEHVAMVKNSMPEEDVLDPQLVRMHQDHGQGQGCRRGSQRNPTMEMWRSMEGKDPHLVRQNKTHGHGQGCGQSSRGYPTLELHNAMDENDYQEAISPERFYTGKRYKDKEKYVYLPGKSPLPLSPTSQSKDYENRYVSRGTQGTASGVVRDDYPGGFRNVDMDPFDGYQRKTQNASKSLVTKGYSQRPHMECRKDYEAGYLDMEHPQYDPYGFAWDEQEDYAYANGEVRGKGDSGHISHDILYRGEHMRSQTDSEHRYIERPFIAKHRVESPLEAEDSQRIYRSNNGLRDFDVGHKEKVSGYVDSTHMGRAFDTPKQGIDYLDSKYTSGDLGGRAAEEIQPEETLHEQKRSTYDYQRYVNVARSQRERVNTSPELVDPACTQRPVGRAHRYADEHIAYNGSDRYADEQNVYNGSTKRKYLRDEEPSRYSLGTKVPNKRNAFSSSREVDDSRPEWVGTYSRRLHPRVPSGHETNLFLEAEDMMDEIYRHTDSRQYGLPNQGKWRKMQEQSTKSSEPGRKYMKTHSKSESSKGYGQPHHIHRGCDDQNHNHKQQRYVGKRSEDDIDVDVVTQDSNLSGDHKGPVVYDLNEDTEGFKRSVQAAFLMYSKILNENPSTRKLYKDQGRSGFLFCIVCGRSTSKVFRDTEGLTKHALMARKARLRAGHLGLCRAICVLMGWNSEFPLDIASWVPEDLPKPEAMARKEDLILWQPIVVVHNISLSNSNHKEWKVIGLEALENIVRAKALIKSKIRICLGHPGDQSVMLVKFLGTFTGLQEAEKLHKHFAEKRRGRADFEQAIHTMNESSEESAQAEADEESLLYGYMGVADDLDKVDFESKKLCKVKSKKEIQDIADAPLRAETTCK